MPERRYDLLIFDWDGTLCDSISRIVTCVQHAADSLGLARREEAAVRGIIGLSLSEAILTLYPHLDGVALEEFRRRYSGHYIQLEAQPSPLFPGVRAALVEYRRQGYRLAVATGKARAGLDRVLRAQGWSDYFDVTRCADETAGKPDPRMLQEILAHCAVVPERALMVGDALFDLHMARNAGVDALAVAYGALPAELLRQGGALQVVERFEELSRWLARPVSEDLERGLA